jgi:hypothetical protein
VTKQHSQPLHECLLCRGGGGLSCRTVPQAVLKQCVVGWLLLLQG